MYYKCRAKDCQKNYCNEKQLYCSFKCACYDGSFSVKKGWLKSKEELDKMLDERNSE